MNHLSLNHEIRNGSENQEERKFLDFIVDGKSLLKQLKALGYTDYISVLGCNTWNDPVAVHNNAQEQLLAKSKSDLPDDFVPLFICPECGDKHCGLIKFKIKKKEDTIMWSDFYYDNFIEYDQGSGAIAIDIGPFIFSWDNYSETIKKASLCK